MYDVAIIGGGLHGSSTAYHLLRRDPGLRICVIEADPTFEQAASAHSTGGVRIQFSQEENLLMSRYGHEFYGDFPALMAVDGEEAPGVDFRRQGYLYIANTADQAEDLRHNHDFQQRMGCDVRLLDGAGLAAKFPSLVTDDVICAVWSPGDGWLNPQAALTGIRRKVRAMGVAERKARVVGIDCRDGLARALTLDDGERVAARFIVNNAGAWAGEICRMLGFDVPVVPLQRVTFYYECRATLEPLPLLRDGQPVSARPDGGGYISGITDFSRAGAFNWEIDHSLFESVIWPRLAHRIPAFEAIRVRNAWPCHYAYNRFDGNVIIGAWPGAPENVLMATGFSGHGLQHAPATGRALAELILDGRFTSIDLDRFHCRRVAENRPEPERGFLA